MPPLFQHRHYRKIARIIASLDAEVRAEIAQHFANALRDTNPNFDASRFYDAATGTPSNGKDKYHG